MAHQGVHSCSRSPVLRREFADFRFRIFVPTKQLEKIRPCLWEGLFSRRGYLKVPKGEGRLTTVPVSEDAWSLRYLSNTLSDGTLLLVRAGNFQKGRLHKFYESSEALTVFSVRHRFQNSSSTGMASSSPLISFVSTR